MHRKALGRGLDALIPTATAEPPAAPQRGNLELPIAEVTPNPFQPRTRFDEQAIRELTESIRARGVLQPIIVRRGTSGYQLVAGERRLRAADAAGLVMIPAIVKDVDDRAMLEVALIENIQRENLNPIEEAKAYHALAEKAGLTHDQISERVGKQRTSISNMLRLLLLPEEVQEMVSRETITAGHARALLGLDSRPDQITAAQYIQTKGFSVRRTESYIRRRLRKRHVRPRGAKVNGLREWETKLQQRFGTHVSLAPGRKGGKITFEYYGDEDLERLLEAWGVM